MSKLESTLTINIGGTEHTLLMSWGLLNRLLKAVGSDADAVGAASFVDGVRDQILFEVLKKRGKTGCLKDMKLEEVDDLEMSSEDVQAIISWATDHILDFFLGAAERAKATEKRFAERTAALQPSPTGTAA